MTREEAIELANNTAFMACIWIDDNSNEVNDVVKFAQLVADHVRSPEWLARRTNAAIAAEREACAQICENYADTDSYQDETSGGITTDFHAKLIRARGQA